MDPKRLMSGIAVVVDDAYSESKENKNDKIFQIVEKIEKEWKIPCYTINRIPTDNVCSNLLQSASFVLLDWNLGYGNASELKREGIEDNIKLLEKARDSFVPVFIFTNENPADVVDELSDLYHQNEPERNFIFIKQKAELIAANTLDPINNWIQKNASVYTLKTWEQAFFKAKRGLFSDMYTRSPDWPKVFWKSYKDDGVDPSSSIADLINNILIGRMDLDIFKQEFDFTNVSDLRNQDIKSVWEEASFIRKENLSENSVKTGDLFEKSQGSGNYLLNVRADCDCIPRQGQKIDDVDLYFIEGKSMTQEEVEESFIKKFGNFNEQVNQAIVFSIHGGKNIRFYFKKLVQKKFSKVKNQRVGRITHPYITRIQQRFALYLQRQGLPRIPEEAINLGNMDN